MSEFILDGKTYRHDELTDESRGLLLALQFASRETDALDRRAGVLQTARNMYSMALVELLPAAIDASDEVEGAKLSINDQKYLRADLSDEANGQLRSMLQVDKLLDDVMNDYSIAETARSVYGEELKRLLQV